MKYSNEVFFEVLNLRNGLRLSLKLKTSLKSFTKNFKNKICEGFLTQKRLLKFKYFKENFRKTSKMKYFEYFTDSTKALVESVKYPKILQD